MAGSGKKSILPGRAALPVPPSAPQEPATAPEPTGASLFARPAPKPQRRPAPCASLAPSGTSLIPALRELSAPRRPYWIKAQRAQRLFSDISLLR